MAYRILLRRDTSENWVKAESVLLEGEPGYETDTGKLKIGDGSSSWSSLDYYGGTGGTGATGNNGATGPVNYLTLPNIKTSSYILELTDIDKIVILDSPSAGEIIIPKNDLTPFDIGSKIMIARGGTGSVSIVGSTGGISINYPSSSYNRLKDTYSIGNLLKIDTDVWYLFGDLEPNP